MPSIARIRSGTKAKQEVRNARWERSWNVLHICNLHATRKLDLMSPQLRRKRTLHCLDILLATGSSAASHFKSNIHNFFLSIFPASFLRVNEKWRLFVLLVDHFFDRESFSKSLKIVEDFQAVLLLRTYQTF